MYYSAVLFKIEDKKELYFCLTDYYIRKAGSFCTESDVPWECFEVVSIAWA